MRRVTKETQRQAVVEALRRGETLEGAALAGGVTPGTIAYWESASPEFREQKAAASEYARLRAGAAADETLLPMIKKAAELVESPSTPPKVQSDLIQAFLRGRGVFTPQIEQQIQVTERRATFVFVLPDGTRLEPHPTSNTSQ